MNLRDALPSDGEADEVVAIIRSKLPKALDVLFEAEAVLLEGSEKKWGGGYTTRLDRRGAQFGGNQLHIYGPHGKRWAYRHTGDKSEPSKYTLPANDKVRSIVRAQFNLPDSVVIETTVVEVSSESILVEVRLTA